MAEWNCGALPFLGEVFDIISSHPALMFCEVKVRYWTDATCSSVPGVLHPDFLQNSTQFHTELDKLRIKTQIMGTR